MIEVIAIQVGEYGGGLREPGTKTERFLVPDDMADASPWWKRVEDAPRTEEPAPALFDTLSAMAKREQRGHRGGKFV